MSKHHLKRLAAPSTWRIKRKGIKYITRPNAGPHRLELGMPLNLILKELLSYGETTRDIKKILNNKTILIDGIRRKDYKFIVGIFDAIRIDEKDECFRVVLDDKKKLSLIKISKDEAGIKPCKIIGKIKAHGKIQINLYDGKNILVGEDKYKVGDSLIISLPKQEIKVHLPLDKKKTVYLMGGKNIGEVGVVEDIKGKNMFYRKKSGEVVETLKKYAFVIGDDMPAITVSE